MPENIKTKSPARSPLGEQLSKIASEGFCTEPNGKALWKGGNMLGVMPDNKAMAGRMRIRIANRYRKGKKR